MDVKLVTVQGNIGAGKSTFLKHVEAAARNRLDVCVLAEPVEEWERIQDGKGNDMLTLFYGDQKRYAFAFQMMAYISRLAILKRAINKGYNLIISERSLTCDREVFARMLANDGMLSQVEYKIYLQWFDEFTRDLPKEHVFYIRTDPSTAAQRVAKRARPGESITQEYLTRCHEYHEDWIFRERRAHSTKVVDGDVDTEDNSKLFASWAEMILGHASI